LACGQFYKLIQPMFGCDGYWLLITALGHRKRPLRLRQANDG